jgi:hypothetical protein
MIHPPEPVAAQTALVPFGLPFFDHPVGGIPSGGVMLLHGEPAAARAVASLAFIESRLVGGVGALVVSSSSPADWPRLPGSGRKPAEHEAILFAQIPAAGLTPAAAHTAWTEILPMIRQTRPGRLILFPALAWFEFVPETAVALYAVRFIAALNSLGCETLLTFPTPRSPRARHLLSILSGLCPTVARLQPGTTPGSVRWTTEHLLHHHARPTAELDLATFAETRAVEAAASTPAAAPAPSATPRAPAAPIISSEPIVTFSNSAEKKPVRIHFSSLMGMAGNRLPMDNKPGRSTPS